MVDRISIKDYVDFDECEEKADNSSKVEYNTVTKNRKFRKGTYVCGIKETADIGGEIMDVLKTIKIQFVNSGSFCR